MGDGVYWLGHTQLSTDTAENMYEGSLSHCLMVGGKKERSWTSVLDWRMRRCFGLNSFKSMLKPTIFERFRWNANANVNLPLSTQLHTVSPPPPFQIYRCFINWTVWCVCMCVLDCICFCRIRRLHPRIWHWRERLGWYQMCTDRTTEFEQKMTGIRPRLFGFVSKQILIAEKNTKMYYCPNWNYIPADQYTNEKCVHHLLPVVVMVTGC